MLAHAFSAPKKVTEFAHTLSCCICRNCSSEFYPYPHFTCPNVMAFQETTSQDGILLKTVQASSMLPHFAYMSIKLLHTVHLLGLILLVAFSDCPPFTYVVSFSFHGKMCNSELGPGAIAAISAATHGGFHQLSSQSASAVSVSVKSGYLAFVYNKDPGQADQPCRIHIPGINVIIRMKHRPSPSAYCIYLPSPAYYYHRTSAKDVKEVMPMFRPHNMIAIKREQQN